VEFLFQLDLRREDSGNRWIVSRKFKKSLATKANLRQFLGDWRARPLLAAEVEGGINLSMWEGRNARVSMISIPPKYGYVTPVAFIAEIGPPRPGVLLLPEDYIRRLDRDRRARTPVPEESAHDQ